ncbi:MAG: hypothetical protein JOZ78_20900 [Chroococcidiopsidaceae cyanobacterium CP_BM_ER_R8_30]|nr:hypothetical protein [Chroococcidiopsidaceae cyanobacterium CP_BM_ER_R8_30]
MPIEQVVVNASPLIESVGDRLQLLRDESLWLSDEVVNLLKQQAGE